MKKEKISIKDIAAEAGVSIASVSRALNHEKGVGEATKRRILKICEQHSFVPNTYVQNASPEKKQTIGIIVPDITSPFYTELLLLAAEIANRHGYQTIFCNSFRSYGEEENYFNLLIGYRVHGILFYPVGEKSMENVIKYAAEVPIVSLNEASETGKIPFVCADESLSGALATDHLIQLGCKNLLFVGAKPERLAHRRRANSFLAECEKQGVEAALLKSNIYCATSFERGYKHFKQFLESGKRLPDGVVAASDSTANGITKAAAEFGLQIPEAFSLIGFDNINSDLPYIELSTVAISHYEHIERALDLLIHLLQEVPLTPEESRVKLTPWLIKRKSCRYTYGNTAQFAPDG